MPGSGIVRDAWHTDAAPVRVPKTRNRAIKACLECRARKSKCDKSEPKCHNCQRNHRKCVYVTDKPTPTERELLSRIKRETRDVENKRCELAKLKRERRFSSQVDTFEYDDSTNSEDLPMDSAPNHTESLRLNLLAGADAAYDDDAEDENLSVEQSFVVGHFLITDRIGNFFRPNMAEEITHTLRLAHPEEPADDSRQASTVRTVTPKSTYKRPNLSLLYSNVSRPDVDTQRPSKMDADRLLEQYWVNVHPITRTVHRPSLEGIYHDLYSDSPRNEVTNSGIALVSACLFAGIVSMDEETYAEQFGGDKSSKACLEDDIQQLTEALLGCCNLSQTKNVRVLQALVVYLVVLCRAHVGRPHLTLVASAIRLAESIGLHRDGTEYGRDAIAVHVRRLIWYQLCFLDIRTTESVGPRPVIRREEYSTKLPLNLDDDELEHHDKSSHKFTDMTSALVDMRCIEVIRSLYEDHANIQRVADGTVFLEKLLAKVAHLREGLLADYENILHEGVPIQLFTRLKIDLYTSRMYAIIFEHYQFHAEVEPPARLLSTFVANGIDNLEVSMAIETNQDLRPWRWYIGALHQHHCALAMLMEFHMRPEQEGAERAWRCLNWVFEVPASDRVIPKRCEAYRILTKIRDGTREHIAAQRVCCSTKILNTTKALEDSLLENENSSGEDVSHPGSTVTHTTPSAIDSEGPTIDMTPSPFFRGWHHHPLPEEPMRSLVSADSAREENDTKSEVRHWEPLSPIYSEPLSERVISSHPRYLPNGLPHGRSTSCCTPPLPSLSTFDGSFVSQTAHQPFHYEHRYGSSTYVDANTTPNATIYPTPPQTRHGIDIVNTPHTPYYATHGFEEGAAQGFGGHIEQPYAYNHFYDAQFTHTAHYRHQPVEQHYDGSFGGQEHQDHGGPADYGTSSHQQPTQ